MSDSKEKNLTVIKDINEQKTSKITRPPISKMVYIALTTLKTRGGTSLSAVKKYLFTNYEYDESQKKKAGPKITRYIVKGLKEGIIIQTKGKGAAGSFKLSPTIVQNPMAKVRKEGTLSDENKQIIQKDDLTAKKISSNPARRIGKKNSSSKRARKMVSVKIRKSESIIAKTKSKQSRTKTNVKSSKVKSINKDKIKKEESSVSNNTQKPTDNVKPNITLKVKSIDELKAKNDILESDPVVKSKIKSVDKLKRTKEEQGDVKIESEHEKPEVNITKTKIVKENSVKKTSRTKIIKTVEE